VTFVDVESAVVRHIQDTLQELGCDRGHAVRADARRFLDAPGTPYDIIFLDPPFAEPVLDSVCDRIEAGGWLKAGGYVYLESPAAVGEPPLPAGWTLLRSKRAGEVGYHLARRDASGALQQ
jgi:16S rRNA (guanine966-N2)-methyltransferase